MTALPSGWEWTTIADLSLPVAKVDPRHDPLCEFDYIDIGSVDGDIGEIVDTQRLTGSDAPSRARQLVRNGDTVLSTVRTYMRKTALVLSDLDGQVASTGFSVLRPAKGVHPAYLFHAVRRQEFVDALSSLQTGSSYPAVRDSDVRSMTVPLAPVSEQERIVAAIDEHLTRLDSARREARAAARKANVLRQGLLRGAFEGGLGVLGTPPEERPLGDVLDLLLDHRGKTAKKLGGGFVESGVPVISAIHIKAGRIRWEERDRFVTHEMFEKWMPERTRTGDVLLTSEAPLGSVAAIENDDPLVLSQRLFCLRGATGVLENSFLRHFLESPVGQNRLLRRSSGTTVAGIRQSELRRVMIPLPSVSDQRRVVSCLEDGLLRLEHGQFISAVEARSAALRRSILAAAFAGRLVPQDSDDEPASLLLERIQAERAATAPAKRSRKAEVH